MLERMFWVLFVTNIRSNRFCTGLKVEAFKGQYSILRGIWQNKILGIKLSVKNAAVHACSQSEHWNEYSRFAASFDQEFRRERERYIEVSYSSVANKWMASFHLSWIDDFGGGNIIPIKTKNWFAVRLDLNPPKLDFA